MCIVYCIYCIESNKQVCHFFSSKTKCMHAFSKKKKWMVKAGNISRYSKVYNISIYIGMLPRVI